MICVDVKNIKSRHGVLIHISYVKCKNKKISKSYLKNFVKKTLISFV